MTSMTNAREWDEAVEEMESIDSQIRCKAVRAPIVKSVIDMSLLESVCSLEQQQIAHSIEPTRPTMLRCRYVSTSSLVIRPDVSFALRDDARLTSRVQLFDKTRPFASELVRAGQ